MEKVIKLGDKEYKLHSSLFTIIDYRNVFGSALFSDIKKLEKDKNIKEEDFSIVMNKILRMIYVLHRPFSKTILYDFLMALDLAS